MDKTTHEIRCQQWTSIINECLASGMNKTAWCKANGISDKQFFYWQRILRKEAYNDRNVATQNLPAERSSSPAITKTDSFVEISIPAEDPVQHKFQPDVVIHSKNLTIEISNTVSSELLSLLGGLLHA